MNKERLSNLSLSVLHDVFVDVDFDTIIDDCANTKARKVKLI